MTATPGPSSSANRRLIPRSLVDRLNGASIPVHVVVAVVAFRNGDYGWVAFFSVSAVAAFIAAYVFQDKPTASPEAQEYSQVIQTIAAIGGQLAALSTFLERERTRMVDTDETIKRLNTEKSQLEPVVAAQRETVDAILAAHAARTSRSARKERLIGFSLGVVGSLIASLAYESIAK